MGTCAQQRTAVLDGVTMHLAEILRVIQRPTATVQIQGAHKVDCDISLSCKSAERLVAVEAHQRVQHIDQPEAL